MLAFISVVKDIPWGPKKCNFLEGKGSEVMSDEGRGNAG